MLQRCNARSALFFWNSRQLETDIFLKALLHTRRGAYFLERRALYSWIRVQSLLQNYAATLPSSRSQCTLPLYVHSGSAVLILNSPRDSQARCQTPLVREPGDQSLDRRCVGEAHAGATNQSVPCIHQRKTVKRTSEQHAQVHVMRRLTISPNHQIYLFAVMRDRVQYRERCKYTRG